MEGRLIGHGVSLTQARRLVSGLGPARVEAQLEALEHLLTRGGKAVPENRAGWLVRAVMENYAPPRGFRNGAQRERGAREKARRAQRREEQRGQQEAGERSERERQAAEARADNERVAAYLERLSEGAGADLEAAALRADSLGRGRLSALMRRTIVSNHVHKLLAMAPGQNGTGK